MNASRHIVGVFDSGIGGMSVVKEIRELMPDLDIIYVGDNARAPYGNKTEHEVISHTKEILKYLKQEGCTHFVSACNSISSLITEEILKDVGIDAHAFVDMVLPTKKYFANSRKNRLLVLATVLTTKNGIYEQELKDFSLEYVGIGEPDLARQIEENHPKEEIIKTISSFLGIHGTVPGTLLLSCTHYPLVKHLFEEQIEKRGISIEIIDPSRYVAQELQLRVDDTNGWGTIRVCATKSSVTMEQMAKEIRGESYTLINLHNV